jgi:Golgi phosphoprotein 3
MSGREKMLSLAEELLLLGLGNGNGAKGKAKVTGLSTGLTGAVLMELVLEGHLRVQGSKLKVAPGGAGIGLERRDEILREALNVIAMDSTSRDAAFWVRVLPRKLGRLQTRFTRRLIDKGIVREEQRRILGLFPSKRYLAVDEEQREEILGRVRSAVLGADQPDERTEILVALVRSCNLTGRLFTKDELNHARPRLKEIADGSLIGRTVSGSMATAQTAIGTAVAASVAASAAVAAGR